MPDPFDTIIAWLEAKGCTFWANWDITDPNERIEAATWFQTQILELLDYQEAILAQRWDVV